MVVAVAFAKKDGDAVGGCGVRTGVEGKKGGEDVREEGRNGYGRHAGRGMHVEDDDNPPVMMGMETAETERGVDVHAH